jgi:hypothetical protein
MMRLMLLSIALDSLQRLIDLLSQVSQILGTNGLNDELFLIAQAKRLSEISVCEGCLRLTEQGLTKLVADNSRCKETMQAVTLRGRPLKTK